MVRTKCAAVTQMRITMMADLSAAREVTGAKVAPAVFAYVWPAMGPNWPAVACYNLTAPIPGHGVKSSLSGKTLAAEGWSVPPAEQAKADAALAALALAAEAK